MAILSDRDLQARLERGSIRIEPLVDPATQIQPASIDLRLGYEFHTFNDTNRSLIDPGDAATFAGVANGVRLEDGEHFIVHPGAFILATTLEWVVVPPDLVARLEGRSSVGRLGIVIHSTAGFIDPGYEGAITLEISNLGRIAVALYPGMRICQIAFEEMSSPVSRPYAGHTRASKYQHQRTTTVSRLHQDIEFRRMREQGMRGLVLDQKLDGEGPRG
jgi:dCTP deaminase